MSSLETFLDAIHPAFRDGDPGVNAKAVETGHVELVRAMYVALAGGDAAGFAAALADDVQLDIAGPPELPFAGRWVGRDDVLAAVRDNFARVDEQRPVIESVVAQGDTVAVLFEETGRVRATGDGYRIRCVQLFTLREGKVARVRQVAGTAPH